MYTRFFGRRKSDLQAVVILLEMEQDSTNLVICRHKNILFAHSIPLGMERLGAEDAVKKLVFELNVSRKMFASMYKKSQIERIVFLSSQMADRAILAAIAKQMELPAQMGDCLAAIENLYEAGIDRRGSQINWATAFGLSLS